MDEEIMLVEGDTKTDTMGTSSIVPSDRSRTVFAEIRSIGYAEYYQAMAYDMVPDLRAIVRKDEYADEPFVKYNGMTLNVVRTHNEKADAERIALVCKAVR